MINLQVNLPGTHGYAFPWDPPHFGIPAKVLSRLADELTDVVVGVAVKAATAEVRICRQSSASAELHDGEVSKAQREVALAKIRTFLGQSPLF